MLMLGLIGEYIGRIYYETKRRPHFLVKETNAPRAFGVTRQGEAATSVTAPVTGAAVPPRPAVR
jgi:hypothetical protein